MIPQTEIIKPHKESFGPQIGILLSRQLASQLVEFGVFNNFLHSTKRRKFSDNHVTKKRGNIAVFAPASVVAFGPAALLSKLCSPKASVVKFLLSSH
jgi:hypothetical protein